MTFHVTVLALEMAFRTVRSALVVMSSGFIRRHLAVRTVPGL